MPAARDIDKRFWEKVNKLGAKKCWVWEGSVDSCGYGLITQMRDGKKVTLKAHRYSFGLTRTEPFSKHRQVLHKCGNRRCVNPRHLYLGSAKQNAADRKRDGMQYSPKGCDSPNSALTPKLVTSIKMLLAQGIPQLHIARKYSKSTTCINRLALGKTYREAV